MGVKKKYANVSIYEDKLKNVMKRFDAESYKFDYGRHSAWIEFIIQNRTYRFEHSIEKAKSRGINLSYGSDAFTQIVLTLEDLARMSERGIYELPVFLEGLKMIPMAKEIPDCFRVLGFDRVPEDKEEVKMRFKYLAKKNHPDAGGDEAVFKQISNAAEEALQLLEV